MHWSPQNRFYEKGTPSIPSLQKDKLRLREMKGSSRARVKRQAFPAHVLTCHPPPIGKARDCHLLGEKGVACIDISSICFFWFCNTWLKIYIILLYTYGFFKNKDSNVHTYILYTSVFIFIMDMHYPCIYNVYIHYILFLYLFIIY